MTDAPGAARLPGYRWAAHAFLICAASAWLAPASFSGPRASAALSALSQDLRKVYAGDLDFDEKAGGVDWAVDPEDVWRLSEFKYSLRGKLELEFGPSTLVVASHREAPDGSVASAEDKSAVWAALFPDEPREITSSEPGHGDTARALFLRFHPDVIGDLFPAKTVEGPGEPRWLVPALRQYRHKINSSWQWDNMPVVTWKHALVFDIDTSEGDRRFYSVDAKKKKVRYEPAFARRTLRPLNSKGLDSDEAVKAFDRAWSAFDSTYAMFGIKDGLDWDAEKERYRPLAAAARSAEELAGVIALLVSRLEDMHAWVKLGNGYIGGYNRFRVTNGNYQLTQSKLKDVRKGAGIQSGRAGKFGYILVEKLAGEDLSDAFDEALARLGDTTGLILDLRFNGGGDETLGRRIAGRFLQEKSVYSKSQYRQNKEDRTRLGEPIDRVCEPRGPWRYEAPVVVLQGEKTMSSAESLVLMLGQAEQVTTMGDRTAGSSGNPTQVDVGMNIRVNVPRWLDLDRDGEPIDRVGVAPDIQVEATQPGDFKKADPVFEAAMKFLTKTRSKKPGKPDK